VEDGAVSMLHECRRVGCATLTLGEVCATHEAPVVRRRWPRGRPFPAPAPLRLSSLSSFSKGSLR